MDEQPVAFDENRHHPSFYLPHGDLVLVPLTSENRPSKLFRVHRGILSYNSPVFSGMLTLPESPLATEIYDGVPLVRMSDDEEDVVILLKALYDSSALSFPRFDPDMPIRVRGALKLATKYQIDSLRKRIVDLLEESWPRSFVSFIRLQSEMLSAETECRVTGKLEDKCFDDCMPEPAAAIRLAMDCDVPSILPAAFSAIAAIPCVREWEDVRRAEPTELEDPLFRTARWTLLDRSELWRIMKGREDLIVHLQKLAEVFSDPERLIAECRSEECPMKDFDAQFAGSEASLLFGCEAAFKRAGIVERFRLVSALAPDPLQTLGDLYDNVPEWRLCVKCIDSTRAKIRDMQEEIWDALPGAFGL